MVLTRLIDLAVAAAAAVAATVAAEPAAAAERDVQWREKRDKAAHFPADYTGKWCRHCRR